LSQAAKTFSPSNVFTQAELTHQQRTMPGPRRWRRWINRTLTAVVVLSAFFYLTKTVLSIQIGRSSIRLYEFGQELEVYLLPFAVAWVCILHFRYMFHTLALSANSIARERQSGTWELLALTGADAGQIVVGKWWAVVRYMGRRYLLLGFMRAVLLLWLVAALNGPYMYYGYSTSILTPASDILRALGIIFTLGFVILATLLNLVFTAACGMAASPGHRSAGIALARAAGTRLLIIMCVVLIPVGIGYLYGLYLGSGLFLGPIALTFALALVTLVDNGAVTSFQMFTMNLSEPSYQYYRSGEAGGFMESIVLSMFLSIGLYIVLTWITLYFARRAAVRQGALAV
jgi:hypothetical protein